VIDAPPGRHRFEDPADDRLRIEEGAPPDGRPGRRAELAIHAIGAYMS